MTKIDTDRVSPYTDTDATGINADFTAIATATGQLNEENLRSEAIDTRQLSASPILLWGGVQANGYSVSLGASTAAGATYESYSKFGGSNNKEVPLNHDSSGATSTTIGDGTKLQVNSIGGISVTNGDIVEIDWTVTLWEIEQAENLDELAGEHVTGNTPHGGNEGSGYGEWCWFVYPKVNTTANTLLDAAFEGLGTITADTVQDISTVNAGFGNTYSVTDFPHVAVIPTHYLQATDTADELACARYARGDQNAGNYASQHFYMRPRVIRGSYVFEVDASATIYGFQLYIGGYWRLRYVASEMRFFLEDDICSPAASSYGVSENISIERAKIGARILQGVT